MQLAHQTGVLRTVLPLGTDPDGSNEPALYKSRRCESRERECSVSSIFYLEFKGKVFTVTCSRLVCVSQKLASLDETHLPQPVQNVRLLNQEVAQSKPCPSSHLYV